MSVKVTLIVESNGHAEGSVRMERTIERGCDNYRFYPSEAVAATIDLAEWASDQLTRLAGGRANTLSDMGVRTLANDEELLTLRLVEQSYRRLTTGDSVYVSAEQVKEWRRRDARLTAMEAAGVDNWEGMDHVVFSED